MKKPDALIDDFPNTRRSLIDILQDTNHPKYASTVQTLAETYWPPVYIYLRSSGNDEDAALDLVQGFFQEIILEGNLFKKFNHAEGRLRCYMITALKNYVVTHDRRVRADPTRGTVPFDRINQEELILRRDGLSNPEDAFERRWALRILQQAIERSRSWFQSPQWLKHWQAFEEAILIPATSGTKPMTREEIAKRLGFTGHSEVTVAIRTVREHVVSVLEQIAGETTDNLPDQRDEFHRVISLLRLH